MPEASVIVPAFNAAGTLRCTLEALMDQEGAPDYEVIVVDDGSRDGIAELAASAAPAVRVIRQEREGPAAARNRGAHEARGRVLAFTDADCVPQRAWLREGVAALDGADLVQGSVIPDPAATRRPFDRTVAVRSEYGLYQTANLFVTRELFEAIGGFEEWLQARLGKPLAEDVWFGWKARRAGARTAFCPGAVIHHAVFPRGPVAYVAERVRLVYFPAMVAKMPELRGRFLHRRWFLTPRTARFDLAVAGASAAIMARRTRSPFLRVVPLMAAVPYLKLLVGGSLDWGRRAPAALITDLFADAVGLIALSWGSIRRRCPVL